MKSGLKLLKASTPENLFKKMVETVAQIEQKESFAAIASTQVVHVENRNKTDWLAFIRYVSE